MLVGTGTTALELLRVQPLGKDEQSTETRDGRTYQVITRRYVLLPQRSGSLRLDGFDPYLLRGSQRTEHVALTTEDAHVFTTTVLETPLTVVVW